MNSVSPTDRHGLRAIDFSTEAGCDQLIQRPTHRSDNTLDLIFTGVPGVVTSNVGSLIGTSDHTYISTHIRTEQVVPEISSFRKIYLKSQGDRNGIQRDLSQLNCPHFYLQDDFIEPLNNVFVEIIDRCISSRVMTFRKKDKA